MGIKELSKICDDIRKKWEVEKIAIVHKVGRCLIGEVSV
jgi:molybdopterin synthase catalytic subunit